MYEARKKIHEIISTFVLESKAKKVIEIGSGNGHNLLFLASRFKELEFIGIEISPTSVYLARRQRRSSKLSMWTLLKET